MPELEQQSIDRPTNTAVVVAPARPKLRYGRSRTRRPCVPWFSSNPDYVQGERITEWQPRPVVGSSYEHCGEPYIDVAFGLPGAHVDGILQDALDAELRIVDVRHEMNATTRPRDTRGSPGSWESPSSRPHGGFTNVLTSITNAYLDRTAVL